MEAKARAKEAEAEPEKADAELKTRFYEKAEGLRQTLGGPCRCCHIQRVRVCPSFILYAGS